MPITKVENGHLIGYKYFGFGGLDKDKKGLKAFKGTKSGNKTAFNLFLTPKSNGAFKINIWLDGPWDNDTWKGKKIGEVNVPAYSLQQTTKFTIDISAVVDHLDKKHAIFLVAEGLDSGGLFDLNGLGFSSDKNKIIRPIVPTISIKVNGVAIDLPVTPVRSTNTNGIVGLDLYETTYKIPSNITGIPNISASASNPDVKVSIMQAESRPGTAVVRFDYKGVVKKYRVVFVSE